MSSISSEIASLRRPQLLIRAANAALAEVKENGCIHKLMAQENALETARRNRDVSYDVRKHILVLAALLKYAKSQSAPTTIAA